MVIFIVVQVTHSVHVLVICSERLVLYNAIHWGPNKNIKTIMLPLFVSETFSLHTTFLQ